MALPATHLRFADAIADRIPVSDWQAYLSGTLYPDSRTVTGIAREKTHDARFLNPDVAIDDFARGWHVHCACDHIQSDIHTEMLDDLARLTPDERWVRVSAAKVIQDMQDAAHGKMGEYLPQLMPCQAPNHESVADIDAYLGFVKQAYRTLTAPQWSDYARLWDQVGLERDTVYQIEKEVQRMRADTRLVERLHAVFDGMVARYPPFTVRSREEVAEWRH